MNSKARGLIWKLKRLTAKARYEMKNLRLKVGETQNVMAKRKPALMVETKRKLKEQAEPEKNGTPITFLFLGA